MTQPFKQKRLDAELARINRQLKDLTVDLDEAAKHIDMAIDLATHSASAYRRAPEHIRRLFNQILFERLGVATDDNYDHHLEAELAPPFDELLSTQLRSVIAARGPKRRRIRKARHFGRAFLDPRGPISNFFCSCF